MRTLAEIDVLSDSDLQRRMVSWSRTIAVAMAGAILACAVSGLVPFEGTRFLAFVLVSAASFVAHEFVHAALFRLLGGPGCRVSFGYQGGMIYTRTNDALLTRRAAYVTLLAPTVLVNLALLALWPVCHTPYLALSCVLVHLSGCTGDMLMCREIHREPAATHVRDTESGIALLKEE